MKAALGQCKWCGDIVAMRDIEAGEEIETWILPSLNLPITEMHEDCPKRAYEVSMPADTGDKTFKGEPQTK